METGDTHLKPKFKVGQCIQFNGQRRCITKIDKTFYWFEIEDGLVKRNVIENGLPHRGIQPAVLDGRTRLTSTRSGGQSKTRRNTTKRKSTRRKYRKT